MSVTVKAPTVETTGGVVQGIWVGEIAAFLAIPYAEAPVGELRWSPPRPASGWEGTRPADQAGAVPPQHASRLELAMGPMKAPEPSEDCLTVNVWTPAPSRGEALPVLVFLHGGGYLSGAGSASWYEGRIMAERGRAVVVTLNYRLGALGYLYLPPAMTGGDPVANLGLLDQLLALEWVQANAAAFGGDAGAITVFGQSAGSHSIVALQEIPRAAGLFRRAILESVPLGVPPTDPAEADGNMRIFLEEAGVPDASLDDLRSLPVETIVAAQRATLGRTAVFGRVNPPFMLVRDGHVLSEESMTGERSGFLDDVDVLIGFTADENRAFLAFDDALWELDARALVEKIEQSRGERAARKLEAYLELRPGEPAAALSDLAGDLNIIAPTVRFAERRAAKERPAYLYRFSWRSDAGGGRLGACHTIELPFVFDNFAEWTEAPMLGSFDPEEVEELGKRVQDAWLAFAATGNPNHEGLPEWRPYDPDGAATMDFGPTVTVTDDPSGGRRHLWA
jgi:para-nitrobenzyl esterase